jgi:hypothetical protein
VNISVVVTIVPHHQMRSWTSHLSGGVYSVVPQISGKAEPASRPMCLPGRRLADSEHRRHQIAIEGFRIAYEHVLEGSTRSASCVDVDQGPGR